MKIQDLGELSGDILLFGGIYSNLAALEALIETANSLGIPAQNMLCSGDVVAYCADAEACTQKMRSLDCPVLSGNCEVQLATGADDCGCGYSDGSECSILSRGWYAHALSDVSRSSRAWMADRPDRIVFKHQGLRYVMVHGGASDIARFIWPVSSDLEIQNEFDLVQKEVGKVDCVIAGHTGISMDRVVNAVRWINSGAVGMPPNDGDPRGCFAVLRNTGLQFERLTYNAEQSFGAMQTAGLTQGYDRALLSGYWPSEDTLPPEMRQGPR